MENTTIYRVKRRTEILQSYEVSNEIKHSSHLIWNQRKNDIVLFVVFCIQGSLSKYSANKRKEWMKKLSNRLQKLYYKGYGRISEITMIRLNVTKI